MSGKNVLCCGDNLEILGDYVKDETVDLVYLERLPNGVWEMVNRRNASIVLAIAQDPAV